jgi:hypothetical protein
VLKRNLLVLQCLKILLPRVSYAIMANKIVFESEDGNELECSLNSELQVYISVGPRNDWQSWAAITLGREDVGKLIEVLQDAKRTMDAEVESSSPKCFSASSDSLN